MLVSKALVPWYDERFTGYLEDKVVHIQHMVHMGFSFAVHPEVFVVHYPHGDSKDQGLVKATSLMQQVTCPLTHSLTHSLTQSRTHSPTPPFGVILHLPPLLTPYPLPYLRTHLLACSQRAARLLKDAAICTALSVLVCGADTSHEGCWHM